MMDSYGDGRCQLLMRTRLNSSESGLCFSGCFYLAEKNSLENKNVEGLFNRFLRGSPIAPPFSFDWL
jgi:hypothetical protein